MAKTLTTLLSVCLLATVGANAADITADGISSNKQPDGTLEVVAGNYAGNITIPASVTWEGREYRVSAIGKEAFAYAPVTEVVMPESITSIGIGAFVNSHLTSVKLPDSLLTLGESAFEGCFSVTSISIGKGVKEIPRNCFKSCMYVEKIEIPDQVESIGFGAFQGCGFSAQSITFGSGLRHIGAWAFFNSRHITTLSFPEGLLTIGDCAFEQSNNLITVTIPASVDSIGISPICGTSLTGINVAEGNAKYASLDGALYTKDLTRIITYPGAKTGDINWPAQLTTIGTNAFAATAITRALIPSSVTSVENAAFYNCVKLAHVKIPSSVKRLGDTMFYGNTSLDEVEWDTTSPSVMGKMCFAYSGVTRMTIPEGLEYIPSGMFYGCGNLKSVTFPSSVKYAEDDIFTWSIGLESVTFQEGIESLGENAFYLCESLEEVTLPNSIKSIGEGFCYGCKSLKKLTLGKALRSLPGFAFTGCESITEVRSYPAVAPLNAEFEKAVYGNATLYVPKGSKASYAATYGWDEFSKIVEMDDSGTETIETDNVTCTFRDNELTLSGVGNIPVAVYDLSGRLLYMGTSGTINLTERAVIVKSGNRAFKIINTKS